MLSQERRAGRSARATARHPRSRRTLDFSATERNGRSDRRAAGFTDGAICVQRLDDSLNSAIHTRYRSSRRSSSMHEPRGPPLKVVVLQYSRHARIPTGRSNERLNEGAREGPPSKAGGAEDPVFDGLLSSSPGVEPRPTPSAPTSARPAHREPAIVGATVHGRRTLREREHSR